MKALKYWWLPVVVLVVFTACKKDEDTDDVDDDDDDNTTITTTCKIDEFKEFTEFSAKSAGGEWEIRKQTYNADGSLAKVVTTYEYEAKTTSYYDMDTLIYDASGKLVQILGYYVYEADTTAMMKSSEATEYRRIDFTYEGENMTMAVEISYGDTSTTALEYEEDELTTVTTTSTDSTDRFVNYKDISWENGNISELRAEVETNFWIWLVGEGADENPNYYHQMLFDRDQIIFAASKNNVPRVVTRDELTLPIIENGAIVGIETVPAGTPLIDHELTYDEEGKVIGVIINETRAQEESKTREITYGCD